MGGKAAFKRCLAILAGLVLGAGLAAGVRAEVVHFKELMGFLKIKAPPGWEAAENPSGTTVKTPLEMSEAKAEFRAAGDKRVEVAIYDNPGMPFLNMADQAVEMETSEEYVKTIEIQGARGWENYKFTDKNGSLYLIVAKRFLVSLQGSNLENTDVLKALAGELNLKKLAELAK